MAKILFEVADPRRCLIKLLEDRYQNHILLGHPEVEVRWIEQTIAYPSFIAQDVESELREVFYKIDLFDNSKLWMCVVVERNLVITAYRSRRGKQGEKIIWMPKPPTKP